MVKSRKKRNLQSRKKYQKRNYRVRLSSKKRNLRRNNKVVSRKRPKRYQRGGAGTTRRSSIAAIGERAVAGGLVGGILLVDAFRKLGRGLKKGYRRLRRKRAPRLSQETMASRALNNLFLKELELVLSSRRDKLEIVSEGEGFKFKFLIKPPENYQNPEPADSEEAYFNPYSDNLEGRIEPPLNDLLETISASRGTALLKKTKATPSEDPFEIGGGEFGSIVIGVHGTKPEGGVKDLEVSAVKLIKTTTEGDGAPSGGLSPEAAAKRALQAARALQNEYDILSIIESEARAGSPGTPGSPGKIHIIRSFLDGIGAGVSITYLPLELFGCDLKNWVSQGVSPNKLKIGMPNYLSYDMVIKFLGQIHKGILYLQELGDGVIHFDLAARNILISQLYTLDIEDLDYLDNIDSYFLLKITDFGLAKKVGEVLPLDMPLPLRWLNPNFLKLSSDQVGFKNIDMWSLVCIGIEMVSRGETPYNTGSFNTLFTAPNFRTPVNLATLILRTVFERYLIHSKEEKDSILLNLSTIFSHLMSENPVGIEPINEFFGNLFYNRRPLPQERLTRLLVDDPVPGEGGGTARDSALEEESLYNEPRILQGVETPIGKADFISYELRHKCVLPFPLQAFETNSSLLGVQFGSTVLLCNKDGNTLKTFVDVGIGDETTKKKAILLRPRSESRERIVKGVLYEYEERLDEGHSVSITEVELTRGPTGKVGNTAGSEEIVANFDYDTEMVMFETEFTEGFTLPVAETESGGEAPVQYVTLSESIAHQTRTNNAQLYAPIEAEINSFLTNKVFYSHLALVQDESRGESLVDPTCVEPGFQIPVKNGFYVPQPGTSTPPFGPIEYNTSEGTIIVKGVTVTKELVSEATKALGTTVATRDATGKANDTTGATGVATREATGEATREATGEANEALEATREATAARAAVETLKLNSGNTIITLSTDIQRKIKTINVKRENFIDIEFELEPDKSREEPPYSIKKPTPSKPSLKIRNSPGESTASPHGEPTFDPRGFSPEVKQILDTKLLADSRVQILRLDDDVLTYIIDGRKISLLSGGSYKKKSKKKSKRGRKRSLKQRGGSGSGSSSRSSSVHPGGLKEASQKAPLTSPAGKGNTNINSRPPTPPQTPSGKSAKAINTQLHGQLSKSTESPTPLAPLALPTPPPSHRTNLNLDLHKGKPEPSSSSTGGLADLLTPSGEKPPESSQNYIKLNPNLSRRFIRNLTSRVTYSLEHEKRFNDFTEIVLPFNEGTGESKEYMYTLKDDFLAQEAALKAVKASAINQIKRSPGR